MHSLWMLAAGLSFALMSVFVKYASAQFSAAEMVFYRSLLQMGVAWFVLGRAGLSIRTSRFGMHVHRGVAGFVSLFMFFYALTTLPVATAMTLNYTSPLFLALLLAWIARERPGRVLLATVGLGFVGAILLLRPTLSADAGLAGGDRTRLGRRSRRSPTGTSASWSAPRSPRPASSSTSRCSRSWARSCG